MFQKSAIVLCAALSAWAGVVAPAGERGVSSADFFHKLQPKGDNSETWSYALIFDNGSKAYVSFSVAERAFAPEMSLFNFKGRNYSVGREFDPGDFAADRARMTIAKDGGENRFIMKGMPGNGHHMTFAANKNEGFVMDFDFSDCAAGKAPNGTFQVGGKTFGMAILAPYCRVSGTIKVGNQQASVTGSAYIDHTWQTAGVKKLVSQGIQFQTYKPGVAGRIFTGNGGLFGFAVNAKGDMALPQSWTANGKAVGSSAPNGNNSIAFGAYTVDFTRKDQWTYRMLNNIDNYFARKAVEMMMGDVVLYRGVSAYPEGSWLHYSILGQK